MLTQPQDEERIVMISGLRSLSSDDQEILMLSGWEGLSASEMSRILDCSPTAVRIRLHRARTRLNHAIDGGLASLKRSPTTRHVHIDKKHREGASEEVLEL